MTAIQLFAPRPRVRVRRSRVNACLRVANMVVWRVVVPAAWLTAMLCGGWRF